MREMKPWAFWALIAAGLAAISIPSAVLLETFQGYWRFLQGMEDPFLRPSRVRSIFHRAPKGGREEILPQFVEFRIRAEKAKTVFLTGDFAQWRPNAYPLKPAGKGHWETILPLPPGRYHYLFVVDGAPKLDPANADQEEAGSRASSVKVVR